MLPRVHWWVEKGLTDRSHILPLPKYPRQVAVIWLLPGRFQGRCSGYPVWQAAQGAAGQILLWGKPTKHLEQLPHKLNQVRLQVGQKLLP